MKKSRFVEYTKLNGTMGSFHVDSVIFFDQQPLDSAMSSMVTLSNGVLIYTSEPYETIKERINEAMS